MPYPEDSPVLLTTKAAARLLSISECTLYRLRKRCPAFPKPVYIGNRSPRWRRVDLEEWARAGTAKQGGETSGTLGTV